MSEKVTRTVPGMPSHPPVPSNTIDAAAFAKAARGAVTPAPGPVAPLAATSAAGRELRRGTLAGPWEQAFWVEVPFAVRSKSNSRRGAYDSKAAQDWREHKTFVGELADTVAAAVPAGWVTGDPDEALGDRPVVVALVAARTLLDAGNLSKSVLDALEGLVYVNDASALHCTLVAVRSGSGQRGLVAFARLAPAAALADQVAAAAALGEHFLDVQDLTGEARTDQL